MGGVICANARNNKRSRARTAGGADALHQKELRPAPGVMTRVAELDRAARRRLARRPGERDVLARADGAASLRRDWVCIFLEVVGVLEVSLVGPPCVNELAVETVHE